MMDIKWEHTECPICHGDDYETIERNGHPLVNGQFGYAVHPVICRHCGMVYLNPRWSRDDYDTFYENRYDELYRLVYKDDYGIEGVINNAKEIWERIEDYIDIDNIESILDVGCGFGHGLEYFKGKIPQATTYGIEASPEGQRRLSESGIELTSHNINNWSPKREYDLIICRHTLEHFLNPHKQLAKLEKAISDDGRIYFAVPDMLHPRTELRDYSNWWEYWFRPVHTHYYNLINLAKLLESAGLFINQYSEIHEEIWCMCSKEQTLVWPYTNTYKIQKKVLDRLL